MCTINNLRNPLKTNLKVMNTHVNAINKTSLPIVSPTPSNLKTSDKYTKTSIPIKPYNEPFVQAIVFKDKDITSKIDYKTNIAESQKWKPGESGLTGVQTNKIINTTYNNIDNLFSSYLNTKDPVANWMTFGKYASAESGTQIRTIEASIESLKTLSTSNASYSDNKKAIKAFSEILSNPESRTQGLIMGVYMAKNMTGNSFFKNVLIDNLKEMAKSNSSAVVTGAMSLGILAIPGVSKAIEKASLEMKVLRDGLVEGNTLIYQNIVPAYEIFLSAEKNGKDGIKALKDNGYGKPAPPNDKKIFADLDTKDPQGFLLEAFTCYKQAKQAYSKGDKVKGDSLMHKGNLLIGCQEQMCILQRNSIFGGKMSEIVDSMTGTMSITDGQGKKNPLLNTKMNTGDSQSVEEQFEIIKNVLEKKSDSVKGWSDFEVRMGIKEVSKGTPNSIAIRVPSKNNPQGDLKYYVQRDLKDPSAQGTITKYFSDGLTGVNAKRNLSDKPKEINQLYVSSDMKIGSNNYQLDKIVSAPFNNPEDALNEAFKIYDKNKNKFLGSPEDLAITKIYENNKYRYYVKTIDSLNQEDKDITSIRELKALKFIGQSSDNIYAIIADDRSVMKNPLFKLT